MSARPFRKPYHPIKLYCILYPKSKVIGLEIFEEGGHEEGKKAKLETLLWP